MLWILYIGIAVAVCLAIRHWAQGKSCVLAPNMTGKVVIVTGGNAGIGYETVVRLAQLGASVVVASRNPQRGEKALRSLKQQSKSTKIEFIKLDLASKKSVQEFVDIFKSKYDRLDVLINNAGLANLERKVTEDGLEQTFQTNHLGHFMLTLLLKDYLLKSSPSRVVNVSALGAKWTKIYFDDLMGEKKYSVQRAYAQSKLANVLFAVEFNRRYENQGVKAVALHPGAIVTDIGRSATAKTWGKVLRVVIFPFTAILCKTTKQGAQTTLYCSLVDHDKLKGGLFYSDCAPNKLWPGARDLDSIERLWRKSLELLQIKE